MCVLIDKTLLSHLNISGKNRIPNFFSHRVDERRVISTVTSQKLIYAEFYRSPHRPGPDHAMQHEKNFMSRRTCGSCDHSHAIYVLTFSAYLAACQKGPREIIQAKLPQYDIYIYIY